MRENEENVVVGCKQTLIWTIRLISFRKENYWQYMPQKIQKRLHCYLNNTGYGLNILSVLPIALNLAGEFKSTLS